MVMPCVFLPNILICCMFLTYTNMENLKSPLEGGWNNETINYNWVHMKMKLAATLAANYLQDVGGLSTIRSLVVEHIATDNICSNQDQSKVRNKSIWSHCDEQNKTKQNKKQPRGKRAKGWLPKSKIIHSWLYLHIELTYHYMCNDRTDEMAFQGTLIIQWPLFWPKCMKMEIMKVNKGDRPWYHTSRCNWWPIM